MEHENLVSNKGKISRDNEADVSGVSPSSLHGENFILIDLFSFQILLLPFHPLSKPVRRERGKLRFQAFSRHVDDFFVL